jgi:regulator of protease activity HflC (stomatin/prohibitin superfamily)
MYYAGRRWYGDAENTATPMDPEFWKVVRVELKDHPSHPIPFPLHWRKGWKWYVWWVYSPFSVLWWGWQRWVFLITGGVYTGLWPFQYVRVYPNEHFKRITKPDGEVALERIENYSDHFRVSDFQAPVRVPRADTQDKIPVSVLLNVIARITNPRDTAFNTDDQWSSRLLASVSSAVTNFSRSRALDIVLSAKDGDEARELATIIRDTTNEALTEIGIEVIRIEILDISVVDAAAAKLLGEEAIARVGKRAAILKAEGAAAGIYETGKAIAKYPEGIVSVNAEAMVRAATAANQNPGAITVLNTGGGSQGGMDANTAALIKEIRDARKRETEEPETPDSTKP